MAAEQGAEVRYLEKEASGKWRCCELALTWETQDFSAVSVKTSGECSLAGLLGAAAVGYSPGGPCSILSVYHMQHFLQAGVSGPAPWRLSPLCHHTTWGQAWDSLAPLPACCEEKDKGIFIASWFSPRQNWSFKRVLRFTRQKRDLVFHIWKRSNRCLLCALPGLESSLFDTTWHFQCAS